MSIGYIGGWLSEKEQRSELARTSKPMPVCAAPNDADLPASMGVSKWMQIENQGQQGACAGHALTSCLELGIYHQTRGTIVQLCRQFAYRTAQLIDGINGDRGSTILGNALAAEKWGTCEERFWPYTGRYVTEVPQVAWDNAGAYMLRTHVVCRTYQDVFNFLAMGLGGVQIGVNWTASFEATTVESYAAGWGGGGHSVSFLDWSDKKDSQGRRYLRLFNSWGTSWGDNGTKLVSPSAIEQMLADSNTVMVGLSDLKDLKPRSVRWIGDGSVFQ